MLEIEDLQTLICEKRTSSSEPTVRTLWMNILAHVFPASEEFGYGSEHLRVAGRNDIHIFKYGVRDGDKYKVEAILGETKGLDKNTDGDWRSAEEQLEAYGIDMPNSSDIV